MRKEKLEELQGYIKELKWKRKKLLEVDPRHSFLHTERYQYELENGITITREKLKKGKSDGSATVILPITKDNQTLLVVQPRVFTQGDGVGLSYLLDILKKRKLQKWQRGVS